jgi:predicted nucleic acid-binding protein
VVLVDTSVWVSHLRSGDARLAALLNGGLVACHPSVVGELACGNLRRRSDILDLLQSLPTVEAAEHDEVLGFIERTHLWGRGIGYIDVHLLVSAMLAGMPLWTDDKRLARVAADLDLRYQPSKA